jgi:ATP-dependent helicase/nuclease subunit A
VRDSLVEPAAFAFNDPRPISRLAKLQAAFLSSKGEPYKPDWLFGKTARRHARLAGPLPGGNRGAYGGCRRSARFRMVEGTQAALILADWLIARYEQLKAGRGFLDFNDLISRTVRLLARQDAGPWVQYKLDKGIDHILLDEAQDTSPDQWSVVKFLAAEFLAGFGARDQVERTILLPSATKSSRSIRSRSVSGEFRGKGWSSNRRCRGPAARLKASI